MATWPCQRCGERFAGDARNLYLSEFDRDRARKLRYVVCPECSESLLSEWFPNCLYRAVDGYWTSINPSDTQDALWTPSESPQVAWGARKVS